MLWSKFHIATITLTFLIILLMAAFAHGEIYRYVDKNGVWHFSPVPIDQRYRLFNDKPGKNESPSLERSPNQEIRDAQNALKKLGYDPGEVDGIFGKMTRNALEHFQRDAGLEITGQLDEQTKLRLGLPLQAPVEGSKSPEVLKYELMLVDVDGNPIEGVKIDYKLKDGPKVFKDSTYITKSDGKLSENLSATHKFNYSFSTIEYEASKTGFYSKNGAFFIYKLRGKLLKNKYETIVLTRPTDYFNQAFFSMLSDSQLKEDILKVINLIMLQKFSSESILEVHSVNLAPFKGNNFLQFKFLNLNVYNSLKLDKYDVGKRLFDKVIRKVLSPLNENLSEFSQLYGYDLTVISHTKSFIDKHAKEQPIQYRFMIPKKAVKAYKNKDISGQQVLDTSVILMDDERIELKLQ